MVEAASSALRTKEDKKRRQRLAAITLRSGECLSILSDSSAFDQGYRSIGRRPRLPSPVLSPSTFVLESFDPTEWMLVQRRRRQARRVGPVANIWTCDHPVQRRQRFPSTHASVQIRQKNVSSFKFVVSDLGRAELERSVFEPICLVPNKGSMGPEPTIAPRSAARVTRFDRGSRCRLGFGQKTLRPAPIVPPLCPAAAIMNRGGGNSSRGGRGSGW
jgi:hypothetical protein